MIKTSLIKNSKKSGSLLVEAVSPKIAQVLRGIEKNDFNGVTKLAERIVAEHIPPIIEKQHQLNPLRIALLSWESLHSISVGGIGAHVTQLAAALERLGHEVHVFTRKGWDAHDHYDCIHGVHYHRVPYHGHSNFIEDVNNMCRSFVSSVFHTEDYMGAHFDVVHAHDWLTSNAMVWIKEGKQRKSILTMHATEYGRCGNNFYGGPSAHIRDHERHGTFCADKVIAVSHALKDEVMWMYNLPDWKVQPIHNGVSTHDFDYCCDSGDVKKQYGIGPVDPMVLFAGRMTTQKGPDILMESIPHVLKFHPNTKFVFAGEGDLRGSVEARAHQLGVSHATRFLGHKSGKELKDLFKATDCVVVPSRNEPFGIVVLEAWSAGKPVVATINGGPKELIWNDVTGYSVQANSDSVAWGIGTTFSNFEHARWMGHNGKRAAEDVFSWDNIAQKTMELYQC